MLAPRCSHGLKDKLCRTRVQSTAIQLVLGVFFWHDAKKYRVNNDK